MEEIDEQDFEVINEPVSTSDYLVTNKYIMLCKVNIITKQHPKTKVTHVHREILSIHRQYHRDRSKYMPHQGKQEMERRAYG